VVVLGDTPVGTTTTVLAIITSSGHPEAGGRQDVHGCR
jgi:hypothetical protein